MPVVEQTQPQIMSFAVSGISAADLRSDVQIRGFAPIVMDEPPALGGGDAGPNPVEYVLASYVGCASVVIRFIAKEIGFSYTDARFEVGGDLDLRGFLGEPGISPHFQTISGRVLLETSESPERVSELARLVEARCPVYNLLRDAGIPLNIAWEIV